MDDPRWDTLRGLTLDLSFRLTKTYLEWREHCREVIGGLEESAEE